MRINLAMWPMVRSAGMLALAMTAALIANFPGDNGRIAFHSPFGCDGSAIATVRTDGTGLRRLTANPCEAGSPRALFPDWSANGRTIAYVSNGQISIVRPGGAAVTVVPVTEPVASRRPTLSPDGEQVAYTRVVDGRQTIFRARLDGTGERRLRRGSLPRWSPGGRNMMFLAPNGRVQVMRAATGRVFHRHHNFFAAGFDWRPDGHRMVFVSRGGDLFVSLPKEPDTPRRILRTRARESSPVWSPDMEQIAFVRGRSIFTMRVPDGTPRRVFRAENGRPSISWQPR
jgi:Tol biopolymer transport system component